MSNDVFIPDSDELFFGCLSSSNSCFHEEAFWGGIIYPLSLVQLSSVNVQMFYCPM